MAMYLPTEHPPVTNIRGTAWAFLRQDHGWRLWLCAGLTAGWYVVAIWIFPHLTFDQDWGQIVLLGPIFAGGWYWTWLLHQIRGRFWRQFAAAHGFTYEPKGNPTGEAAVMFRQGHSRQIRHVVAGVVNRRHVRIFSYQFTVGSGKTSHTYPYTVFEFKFTGHFPHLYCNQLFNSYGVKVGEVIPLPLEFEKQFTLYAPKEYEIEALEIFTPDLLADLLDRGLQHDIEIVDQELLIFTAGYVKTVEALEREFADAIALAQRLAPKLDRFRFTPIGHHAPSLTQ